MIKKALFLFLVIGSVHASAQNDIINGTIIDNETGEPLAFATVGIQGSPHGTISNTDGEFVFFVPAKYAEDTLSISYVGFQTFKIPIQSIQNQKLKISLKENIVLLEEIVVNGEQLTAKQIIQKSLEQLENNYSIDPFITKGFFRDIREQNGKTVYLTEAAIDIKDQGYSAAKNRPKKFFLRGVRASDSRIDRLLRNSLLNSGNAVTVNLEYNFWLNRLKHIAGQNDFTVEDVKESNGKLFYIIRTEQLASKQSLADKYQDMKYKLIHRYHVETETFAIHKVEHLEESIDSKYVGIERPYEGDTLFYSKKGWNQIVEFEEYQGKMYLKYHDVNYAFDIVDEKNNRIFLDMKYQFIFIVTDIVTGALAKPEGEKMSRSKPLASQPVRYEKTYWDDPSNAKLVPLTRKQVSDLEAERPLEEQFKSRKKQTKTYR